MSNGSPLWRLLPTFNATADMSAKPPPPGAPERAQVELELAAMLSTGRRALNEAVTQAAQIKREALEEAEHIRAAAADEGYQTGLDQARNDAFAQVQSEWNDRAQNLQADVRAVIASIQAGRTNMWKQAEKDIVAFAVEMAQKIIKTEVQQNPKVIGEVIRHALRRVVNKDHIRIRISPQDIDAVRAQREDLLMVLDGAEHLDIIDDRRVQQGGCLIETTAGNIDAKIDTQLERLITSLEVE